jgi:hypothetical protein
MKSVCGPVSTSGKNQIESIRQLTNQGGLRCALGSLLSIETGIPKVVVDGIDLVVEPNSLDRRLIARDEAAPEGSSPYGLSKAHVSNLIWGRVPSSSCLTA